MTSQMLKLRLSWVNMSEIEPCNWEIWEPHFKQASTHLPSQKTWSEQTLFTQFIHPRWFCIYGGSFAQPSLLSGRMYWWNWGEHQNVREENATGSLRTWALCPVGLDLFSTLPLSFPEMLECGWGPAGPSCHGTGQEGCKWARRKLRRCISENAAGGAFSPCSSKHWFHPALSAKYPAGRQHPLLTPCRESWLRGATKRKRTRQWLSSSGVASTSTWTPFDPHNISVEFQSLSHYTQPGMLWAFNKY